jgi:serine/threonine-protein kinase
MASIIFGGPAAMNAEKLNQLFEEPAPVSSIRKASPAQPESRSCRELTPGTVLGDKYAIERRIGEGAMGVVFAARHLGLDETVAIKFVRPDVEDTAGAMARFAREAKLAARIHSEHVAKVFDVGVLEPLGPFIVMEYLQGASLAQVLETEGALPAERLVGYLLQACEALAAAHAVGVVHRDVKPDNLFVTRRGGTEVVRLLDFGIAQVLPNGPALDGDTANGPAVVLGSPLYMAPEQLRPSSIVDARADIWAIGVVSYELLSGNMPFEGGSLPEICASILEAEPPELGPSCPAELSAIVKRCLMKDPARRFATVAELAAALLPLAARDAHSYASRASSILRASSAVPTAALVAKHVDSSGATRETVAPARDEGPRRRSVRFHSSALVASTTILALAALGVVATLSRASSDEPPPLIAAAVVARQLPVGAGGPELPVVVSQPAVGAPASSPPLSSELANAMSADESAASMASEAASPVTSAGVPRALTADPSQSALASPPGSASVPAAHETVGADVQAGVSATRGSESRVEPKRPSAARVGARRAAPIEARLVREAATRRRPPSRVRLVEPPARPRLVTQDDVTIGKQKR